MLWAIRCIRPCFFAVDSSSPNTQTFMMIRRSLLRLSNAVLKPFLALSIFTLVFGFLASGVASAHSANQSLLYLNVSDRALTGTVEFPFADVREVLGLRLEGTDEEITAEITSAQQELFSYADEHLSIGAAGIEWATTFQTFSLFREPGTEIEFVVSEFETVVPDSVVPRQLEVTFDPFFDEVANRVALLLIGNDWSSGVFDNGEEVLLTYSPARRSQIVDLGETSQWSNFTSSISLGVDHIKTGPDHILFVLALLLPAVLIFSLGGWHPTESFMASLWRILKIATMFTLAHSITFTLAGLGILPLPSSKLIETIIAISIAAAALHNIKPILPNREWMLSFVFGLFHGMGFASLVSGLDASKSTQLISLLGRNVGIEIGQAAVILMMFPMLFILRRTKIYRWVLFGGSLALAGVSLAWAIERSLDQSLGTDTLVEKFVRLPRAYVVIVGLTVVAAIVRVAAGRMDQLLENSGVQGLDGQVGSDSNSLEVFGTKV